MITARSSGESGSVGILAVVERNVCRGLSRIRSANFVAPPASLASSPPARSQRGTRPLRGIERSGSPGLRRRRRRTKEGGRVKAKRALKSLEQVKRQLSWKGR
jgi:hypothetical protein